MFVYLFGMQRCTSFCNKLRTASSLIFAEGAQISFQNDRCNNQIYVTQKFSLLVQNKEITYRNSKQSCNWNRAAGTSNMSFEKEKEMFLKMGLEEKRSHYRTKNPVTLDDIQRIQEYFASKHLKASGDSEYQKMPNINSKVSIFVGDITALEVDAIVNAANCSLRGGGGVDGAIHLAAGRTLLTECSTIGRCQTGDAVITGGYKLPAKYVIHTVGPIGEKPDLLRSCYNTSLNVAIENGCKSVAFPCISTGVYGYPNDQAAHVALKAVRECLEKHEDKFSRVIFCLFLPVDVEIYENLVPKYFP